MTENNIIYKNTIQINTFECDFNRKWKPAAFFQYLSEAAMLHAEILGCGYEAMLAQNLFWVHSRMKIKFFRFPEARETITIHTWPKTIQQKLFFIRDFIVMDTAGRQVAAATSAWLIIDAQTRRLIMPQTATLNLPSMPEQIGLAESLEKLPPMQAGEENLRVKAAYSAVDLLGHVTNSRYVEWVCDTFPIETYADKELDWLQINYEREIRPGEDVSITSIQSDNDPASWSVEGQNLTSGTRAFEALLRWKSD